MHLLNGVTLANGRGGEALSVCGRCGSYYRTSQLQWQNLIGSLRCFGPGTKGCFDDPANVLPSQRQDRIAKVLAQVPQYGEPEMDPKLIRPPTSISSGY